MGVKKEKDHKKEKENEREERKNRTDKCKPRVLLIKLSIYQMSPVLWDIYTFTPRLCVSCVLHHTETNSQTDAHLAYGNPNSQCATSDIKIRRDVETEGWWWWGEWKRVTAGRLRDSDVQMRSETIDLCGGWELSPSQKLAEGRAHVGYMCTRTHGHAHAQSQRVTLNKCHPHVRWPGPAGPAVCSLACASAHNRCCFPAPHSQPPQPLECSGLPPGTGERTPDTPAHTHTHKEWRWIYLSMCGFLIAFLA